MLEIIPAGIAPETRATSGSSRGETAPTMTSSTPGYFSLQICAHSRSMQSILLAAVPVFRRPRTRTRGRDWPKWSSTPSCAEIGRAGRPDGADAGRGQHGDDRFGDVRQKSGDAISRQRCRRRGNPAATWATRSRSWAKLSWRAWPRSSDETIAGAASRRRSRFSVKLRRGAPGAQGGPGARGGGRHAVTVPALAVSPGITSRPSVGDDPGLQSPTAAQNSAGWSIYLSHQRAHVGDGVAAGAQRPDEWREIRRRHPLG